MTVDPLEPNPALWSLLFHGAPDAMSISDLDTGVYLDVNDAFLALFGQPREAVVGQSSLELGVWADSDGREPFLKELEAQGRVGNLPLRWRDPSGRLRLLEIAAQPVKAFGRSCLLASARDRTDKLIHEGIAEARLRLQAFAEAHSLRELLQATLDEAGELVDSPIGFYHFMEADQRTLRLQAWSTRTEREFCKAEGHGAHYGVDQAGVWVDCVRERRPVIHNDYAALPHKRGLPPGHAAVVRELVVPVIRGGRIMAILGVGNKPSPYGDLDVEAVRQLADQAWDIVERKMAEESLRSSEALFRAVFDSAPLGICYADLEGRFLRTNRRMADILGRPQEALQGLSYSDITHPEDLERDQWLVQSCLAGERSTFEMEKRYLRPDGSVVWVRLTVALVRDETGLPRMFVGQVEDITERRQVALELQASERRFRGLFEALKEGFALHEILTDETGKPIDYRFLEVNAAFEAMTGIPRSKWIGRRVKEILPTTEAVWIENYGRVALTGEPWEIEEFSRDLGRWYQVMAFSPAPRHFAVLTTDITSRKQAEADMAARAQERQVLLSAASVARVVPFSLDEEHGFVHLAESVLEVLGQPAIQFRRHPQRFRELLRAEDRPLLDQALAQARAGGLGVFEASLKRGEKQVIWTRWTLAAEGREIHGVIQDLTESHELQAQLLQSQKLESLGTMLSGITHDFNNLLMSILGYAEVLKALPDLPPPAQRGLEVINRAAQRGKGLVEQLLRFTRKSRTDRAEHDLNATAQEVQTLLLLSLEKRIRLNLELDPELPQVMVDAGQIHQVLMNLATNARDAIPGEGCITIRSGMEILSGAETQTFHRPPGAYVYLEVEDTGAGMNREVLARVFEPFFTTKPVGKGTGLGLSVVHGIVEAHRGILRCNSEPGRGTRFRVLLPVVATESLEAEGASPLPGILLLAEAGPAREEALRLLDELGYPVVLEGEPLSLIARHGLQPFGVVLLEAGRQELWAQLHKPLRTAALVGLVADPSQPWPGHAAPVALLRWPLQAQEFIQTLTRILGARD